MEKVIVFIYAKGNKIKALNIEESKILNYSLIEDGWKHTKTLDACVWIQYLCNDCEDLGGEVMSMFS